MAAENSPRLVLSDMDLCAMIRRRVELIESGVVAEETKLELELLTLMLVSDGGHDRYVVDLSDVFRTEGEE